MLFHISIPWPFENIKSKFKYNKMKPVTFLKMIIDIIIFKYYILFH